MLRPHHTVLLPLCLLGVYAQGHHSVHAHFDVSKEIQMEGVIKEAAFASPHSYFVIEVIEEDGGSLDVEIESWSHVLLRRQGWTEDTIKVGDNVRIIANPARESKTRVLAQVFFTADGQERRVMDNLPR